MSDLQNLIGRTLARIERSKDGDNNDALLFVCTDGGRLMMHHLQDCCESVEINDIAGDLDDLIGSPILIAEERSSEAAPDDVSADRANRRKAYEEEGGPYYYGPPDSETWTFYTFRTVKGTVDIRWFGSSNGYYSESVDCLWVVDEVSP